MYSDSKGSSRSAGSDKRLTLRFHRSESDDKYQSLERIHTFNLRNETESTNQYQTFNNLKSFIQKNGKNGKLGGGIQAKIGLDNQELNLEDIQFSQSTLD